MHNTVAYGHSRQYDTVHNRPHKNENALVVESGEYLGIGLFLTFSVEQHVDTNRNMFTCPVPLWHFHS